MNHGRLCYIFQITANTRVCSLHFLPSDYETKGYRKINILRKTAVPSVFDWKNFTTPKRKPPTLRPLAPKKRYACLQAASGEQAAPGEQAAALDLSARPTE